MIEHTDEKGGVRRRTNAEAVVCSQPGCPGDGRYQPPGRGHLIDCQHDAVGWVWGALPHTFTEDVGDASMCVCGVPALTHDSVYPPVVGDAS